MENIVNECKALEDKLIELRRELHKVPEIGGELPETRKIVCRYLDEIGVPYKLNPDDDGLVAEIKGGKTGKTIAFRADMDGLHINEDNSLPYKSIIDGQMHGCGHDAHTAILLVAAEIINKHKDELCGNVRLLFQSGEETGTGAKEMLKIGAIDGVDAACAIHVGNIARNDRKPGEMVVLPGPVSAGKNKFTVTVYGKGTHTAFPDDGIDPILIASNIVSECAKYSQEELPKSAILNFGTFNAGVDHNTIPETATLKGGIRVQDPVLREKIGEKLIEISEAQAKKYGGRAVVDLKRGSATVMNDVSLSEFVANSVAKVLGREKVTTSLEKPLMGSDDFANYASIIPSVYFILHTNNPDKNINATNHNPSFDIDEDVLWEGVAAYTAIALDYLI